MKKRRAYIILLVGTILLAAPALAKSSAPQLSANRRPNVILVMTDDQGYGDLGCHGNPILKTPHLDRLHSESVRFTDFHVSPFCTPTRAALMTGHFPGRSGAYRTTSNPPWNFAAINELLRKTGPWMVNVKKAGRYRITLRQYPVEAKKPVVAVRAKVQVAGQEKELPVKAGAEGVVFEMELPVGPTELRTFLYDKKGHAGGAYFTEVELL